MDFAAMKRRELQALCKLHRLPAGGTNAGLVARLAATLSGSGGEVEEAVGVVVGKGCLKRSAGGASGVDSDAGKKVTFELEEDEEAEVGVTGRGRRRSHVTSSPAVAKTRGRQKAGEAPPGAKGNGGDRRRTRSQAGGGSADESDSGEAGADAMVKRSVTRKKSAKAEQEEVDLGEAVGRKHQLKRKTRENDIEDVDASGQVGDSRRSTRSSSLLLEPAVLLSPVEKKRGRMKPADVKEKTCAEEQPTEALHSGRTLRSGVVVVAPVPPIVSESKKSKRKVQEEEPDVEKVANVEISRRTTRSSAVAAPLTSPSFISKKRGRKTDDVHLDGGPDMKMENKRQSGRLTTCSSILHLASAGEDASREQVAAPSKGLPLRRSRRNPSETSVMSSSNTSSESSKAPTEGNGLNLARPTKLNVAKDGVEDGVHKLDGHVGLKKSKLRKGSATVATSGGEITSSDSSGKASAIDIQIKVPAPVRRLTRKSVAQSFLEHGNSGMHEDVEKQQTMKKPVGRSTRSSVAPVILEKGSKDLTKEAIPEAHVKRPTRKSVVPVVLEKGGNSIITETIPETRVRRSTRKPALPMVNSENKDHCEVASSENFQSNQSEELQKQPTAKQPVRRLTRKSAAPVMVDKDSEGVPDMLNNENGDHTEMQSDKVGHLEKQSVTKEPARRSTGKSVVPDLIEKENKSLHEKIESEVSVRTPGCKSFVPNTVNKSSKDHNEFVRMEDPSVKTGSAHTSLRFALQNDESVRRTTRQSSKLVISPPQTKPTASRGRPAKRRRTTSLQESMLAEEQKEDHTNDVVEVATSTDLEIGVLPFAVKKSELLDSQLNSEPEDMVVVEPGVSRDKDDGDILEFELHDSVVGTNEKPPSDLSIPDCKHEGALSEEAGHSIENDAGRRSPNFEQSPIGPQFLFSQKIAERSATHKAVPFSENGGEESDVHKVECQLESIVSSKYDSFQGSDENSEKVEENGGCMFPSQQNKEQEGVSITSCPKELVASAHEDPSDDVNHVVSDGITKDVICKDEEKKDFIPTLDINAPPEISPTDQPDEHVSGVSRALFLISQSSLISDEVNYDNSRLESQDGLDNRIASSNTVEIQQDIKDECNLHNGVTQGIHASGMSEGALVEVPRSGKMLLPDLGTSSFQDVQLNLRRDGNEFEEHSFSFDKDGSVKNNMSQLGTDPCQEQEPWLPNDLSAVKSLKGSTTCEDECVIGSGIGQTSGSIVKGHTIAMDAPEPAKQGYNMSQSASALCMNREKTPASKTDALEPSSDHSVMMDSSAGATQSVSCRLSEAGLAVGNPANKLLLEQVQQYEIPLLEGTLDKTAQGLATESNQEYGLSVQAEQHSLKNQICSSLVGEPKDIHVEYGVEKVTSPESVSDHVTSIDLSAVSKSEDCAYTSVQDNENEGLIKSCHEQRQIACQQVLLEAANCMNFTNPEEVAYDDENKKSIHSSGISSSYEKIDAKGPVKHTSGLTDALWSSSLISSTDDTVDRFKLTDFVDELTGSYSTEALQQGLKEQFEEPKENQGDMIEASTDKDLESGVPPLSAEETLEQLNNKLSGTEVVESVLSCDKHGSKILEFGSGLNSGKNILSDSSLPNDSAMDNYQQQELSGELFIEKSSEEPKENKVTHGAHPGDIIEAGTAKDLESGVVLLPAEETSNMRDEQLSTKLPSTEVVASSLSSDKYSSNILEFGSGVNNARIILSDNSLLKDSSMGNYQQQDLSEKNSIETSPGEPKENQVIYGAHPSIMIEAVSADDLETGFTPPPTEETSKMRDEQLNPKLSGTEVVESSLIFDKDGIGSGVKNILSDSSLPKDASMDNYQQQELSEKLSTEKSCEESAICWEKSDPRTMPGTNENPSFNMDGEHEGDLSDEVGRCHVELQAEKMVDSEPDSQQGSHEDITTVEGIRDICSSQQGDEQDEQLIAPMLDADTSALPDEQPNPELDSIEGSDMHGDLVIPSAENEDSNSCHVELQAEKMVSSEPESHQGSQEDLTIVEGIRDLFSSQLGDEQDEQLVAPQLDADTSALPDEQPNPELDSIEGSDMHDELVIPSAENEDSHSCHVELQVEKMDSSEPESHQGSQEDLTIVEGIRDLFSSQLGDEQDEQLMAPELDADTSALPDEQPNPELDSIEGSDMHDELVIPSAENEDSPSCHVELQVEKMVSSEPESHQGSQEDLTIVEGIRDLFSSQLGDEQDEQLMAPQLDADTSALPDEQPNPELGSIEVSDMHDELVIPSAENEDSHSCHVELQVEKVSSEPESHQGSQEDLTIVEGISDLYSSQLGDEQDEQLIAPQLDAGTSALPDEQRNPELDLIEGSDMHDDLVIPIAENEDSDTCHVDVQVEKMVSSEPESHQGSQEDLTIVEGFSDLFSSQLGDEQAEQLIALQLAADTSALPDEQPNPELDGGEFEECNLSRDGSGVFETGYLKDNLFQYNENFHIDAVQGKELRDDLPAPEQSTIGQDESVLGSEEINTKFQYEKKKELNKHNDDQATPILASHMSEHALLGGSGNGMTLLPTTETSPLPDEQFDAEVVGEEFEKYTQRYNKDATCIFSSESVNSLSCLDHKEEYNVQNDCQATPAIFIGGMPKLSPTGASDSGMVLPPVAETSALTDEQLNSKLEDDKEENLWFDTNTGNISDAGLMENSNLFSLPNDDHIDTCYEHEIPISTPAAKSAGESAVYPDESFPGSVEICQTSRRRRIDEISKQLLSFNISSTSKGSRIAMDSSNTKQGDNLGLNSLLGNMEDAPAANADHPAELNTDWSVPEDSSRQGTTDGL